MFKKNKQKKIDYFEINSEITEIENFIKKKLNEDEERVISHCNF